MSTSSTPRNGEGIMPSEHHGPTNHARRHRSEHTEDHSHTSRREDRVATVNKETAETIAGGSTLEVLAGAGAAALGILGLVGFLPTLFVTIGIIAAGAGLMLAGASMGAKYEDVLNSSNSHTSTAGIAQTGGGITAETMGGAAGIALGILALVGVESVIMVPIALITLGGAMAFGAGATKRLSQLIISASDAPRYKQRVANESVKGAAAMQLIAGLGAAVLGVLTLVGVTTGLAISLIAVIALGGGLLVSGVAVGGKFITMLYQQDSDFEESRRPESREFHSHSEAHPV